MLCPTPSLASACVKTAAELCLLLGHLIPRTCPLLLCWQEGTWNLLSAADKHLF